MTEHKPWLSLPDEEPPERGLAELMAAARMKAEVMASPPWWKRLFAVMRRPPVLALATVMILVCGVIVVGRHHDQAAAPAPAIDVPAGHLDVRTRGAAAEPPPPPPERHPEKQVEQPIDQPIEQPIEQAPVEEKAVGGHAPTANRLEADDQPLDTTSPKTEPLDTSPRKADVVHGEPTKAGLNKPADPLARCRAAAARRDCAAAKACVKDTGLAVGDDATLKSCL